MTKPVAIFLFKRPNLTREMLTKVCMARPSKVYIFQDAPRSDRERMLADQVSKIVLSFIEDNPNIKIIFDRAPHNLGIQKNIILGVTKVLKLEKDIIVLEDDCMPSSDFFKFVSQMLDRYVDDNRVMSITGSGVGETDKYSYHFSRYQQCWGWATWRRAWKLYDDKVVSLGSKEWRTKSLLLWSDLIMRNYFNTMIYLSQVGQVKSWAFKWSFAHFMNDGLAVIPSGNLISNLGFDSQATNTTFISPLSKLAVSHMQFPLSHPPDVVDDARVSSRIEKYYYKNPIAILGMLRQLFYWKLKKYAHRT